MDARPAPELLDRLGGIAGGSELLARLTALELPVHLVGGAVRDLIRGAEPEDLDLVVEGDPGPLLAALGPPGRTHDRFGTATVELAGVRCDIARARRERYAYPGALPDVEPAPLAEDLWRRDFTVNALALAVTGDRTGELVAVPQALADLDAQLLRVLHDASFSDDPTRLVRLARYAGRLSFTVEPHTLTLARHAVDDGALETVSGTRLGVELSLAAAESSALTEFEALRRLGVDHALEPGFGIGDPALVAGALALLQACDRGVAARVVLAGAVLNVPEQRRALLLDRLALTAAVRDPVLVAAARAPGIARAIEQSGGLPSRIAAAVGAAPPEAVALAGAFGPAEPARAWLERLRHVRIEIGGDDLLAAGIPAGPAIGAGLAAARTAVLDGRAPDRESQLVEALRAAAATG